MKANNYLIHIGLFILTFITTLFAGYEWTTGQVQQIEILSLVSNGINYAIAILFFLSAHEFGHYFAAKYHKVETTLPYYIPIPPILGMLNFGTLGAVIKTKSAIKNNKVMFDIGVYGPISGFIAALIILIYGFITLPSVDYILSIHPDYFSADYGKGAVNLEFGNTIAFVLMKYVFSGKESFVPPMSEIYHYPFLCVGWFGLFVTSMNMIPIGQLDGGHVVYSMFGEKKHESIASVSFILIVLLGVISFVGEFININIPIGWSGWLFWAVILYFIIKIKHPPVEVFEKLDKKRVTLGWISLLIMLISFAPSPFVISGF